MRTCLGDSRTPREKAIKKYASIAELSGDENRHRDLHSLNTIKFAASLTGFNDMIEGREPLLDGRRDGPEDEDEGQVHVPHQVPAQHPTLLVEAVDVARD